ncbi:MAG: hypothetical protein ACO222_07030 [Polynucleobacter sp.]|jgi:hypothetical protein
MALTVPGKPYTIAVDPAANITEESELFDWVQLNIGKYGLEWEVSYDHDIDRTVYYFPTESQALLFALRWAQ